LQVRALPGANQVPELIAKRKSSEKYAEKGESFATF